MRLFPEKLKSKWSRLFIVTVVCQNGAIEIQYHGDMRKFKVNDQWLKHYYEGDIPIWLASIWIISYSIIINVLFFILLILAILWKYIIFMSPLRISVSLLFFPTNIDFAYWVHYWVLVRLEYFYLTNIIWFPSCLIVFLDLVCFFYG